MRGGAPGTLRGSDCTPMKLLAVTPTLGTSAWLADTVASIAAFGPTCQHVIVAPSAMQGPLTARFPKCTVIIEPMGGMYAAINDGIETTQRWDAFTYINDDDLLLPDFRVVIEAVASASPRQ